MAKYVTLSEATKSDDWKCTGGINAGQDSYRSFASEKTGEVISVVDGKDERGVIESLKPDSEENQY